MATDGTETARVASTTTSAGDLRGTARLGLRTALRIGGAGRESDGVKGRGRIGRGKGAGADSSAIAMPASKAEATRTSFSPRYRAYSRAKYLA